MSYHLQDYFQIFTYLECHLAHEMDDEWDEWSPARWSSKESAKSRQRLKVASNKVVFNILKWQFEPD